MVRLSYERLRLGETWFSSYASELIISEVKWTSASDASPSAMACNEKEVPRFEGSGIKHRAGLAKRTLGGAFRNRAGCGYLEKP